MSDFSPSPYTESPFLALPWAVVCLALVVAGVEGYLLLSEFGAFGPAKIGMRGTAIQEFGFNGAVVSYFLETGRIVPGHLMRLFTYSFVQPGFSQAVFIAVLVLALGKLTAESLGNVALLIIFFASAFIAAFVYGLVFGAQAIAYGGYPGVFGLIGAYTFIRYQEYAASGGPKTRAFKLIAVLAGLRLFLAFFYGWQSNWVADFAAFPVGVILAIALVPGAFAGFVAKMRRQ
ncbi:MULTISPECIES: rhomboid family intramembrane serine protease [Halocynthiibacter]|uniref:Rhomboid family intramembrane serine protease n=1 Tax=Halocynthiibacter halioticoli TaxID=2986804 RepID=A0AAE3IZ83_9RHOB|nr:MULTISPECIES: rhomboid family intramembrane serine protease [Halocynthiibacter]MCV6823628.1 rhomboid family intramembrane serine protease [Halocynthiibacter halioticoli]MCW4056629.1 rhomboid family intramembrane serine protease [Halocynthiibacter sp. SDUM655004]